MLSLLNHTVMRESSFFSSCSFPYDSSLYFHMTHTHTRMHAHTHTHAHHTHTHSRARSRANTHTHTHTHTHTNHIRLKTCKQTDERQKEQKTKQTKKQSNPPQSDSPSWYPALDLDPEGSHWFSLFLHDLRQIAQASRQRVNGHRLGRCRGCRSLSGRERGPPTRSHRIFQIVMHDQIPRLNK